MRAVCTYVSVCCTDSLSLCLAVGGCSPVLEVGKESKLAVREMVCCGASSKVERQEESTDAIRKCFSDKKNQGTVEERLKDMKTAVVDSAEHLHWRRERQKRLISDTTVEGLWQNSWCV